MRGYSGEIEKETDPGTGWELVTLTQGKTAVRVAPDAGANAFSIRVDSVEFLRQPESLDKLRTSGFGNPVLYPTPNRVKDAHFTFRDREFRFQANSGKNFIHGLVRAAPWKVVDSRKTNEEASITCAIEFSPGTEWYAPFPLSHRLLLTITVGEQKVRWDYEVDNRSGTEAVPFGFALHPYFVYQGERKETYLTIPATHWMESEKQLPSGKLVPGTELPYRLKEPMSLEGTTFDDVFFGMRTDEPTVIDFRGERRRIRILASPEFTHLVVWTPAQPHFGIESQTCSTDAHNLDALGFREAAHVQVCEPGQSRRGWVVYEFAP
jgi:aldose 1-epimerase